MLGTSSVNVRATILYSQANQAVYWLRSAEGMRKHEKEASCSYERFTAFPYQRLHRPIKDRP